MLLVVGVLCAIYVSLSWYGFDLLEEGYFLTNARRVQLGGLPYRDFDTPYTPGVFVLYAQLMRWLGPNLVALRQVQIGGRALTYLALYATGRQLLPKYFALLPPLLICLMDTAPELWGIHPGWLTAPFVVLAVLSVALYLQHGRSRWLFVSGLATGVAFAFKQNLAVYGLIATLWFLVVAERHLPAIHLPGAGDGRLPRALRRPAALLRVAVQAAALALLPVTAAVIVRAFVSPLVVVVFVLPLAALSGLAAARIAFVRRPGGSADAIARELAFYARPALVLLGFTLVTIPWLVALVRALHGRIELLKPLVGQIDLTGYFFGMDLPGPDHLRLVAWALFPPVLVVGLASGRMWGRLGLGAALAALLALLVQQLRAAAGGAGQSPAGSAGSAEPWNAVRGAYGLWEALVAAWRGYAEGPHPTADLILYLPTLAFWAAFVLLALQLCRRASTASLGRSDALLRLWYLAAGAALLLNQYPRTDEIHWLWSAGVLLIPGAGVLAAWFGRAERLAPVLRRSASGRAALRLALVVLPLVATFPHVWWRLQSWMWLTPPPAESTHAAERRSRADLRPLALPDGGGQVWLPREDLQPIQEVVDLLLEKTAPGEPIFTYPVIPGFYFLADRPNPTRFNHLFPGMASPADQQQILQQLEQVRYIVWDDGGAHLWVQPGDNLPVTKYIQDHFRVERFIGPYTVLSRDAEGPRLPYLPPAPPAR